MKNKPKIIAVVIIFNCLLSTLSVAQTTLTGKVLEDKSQAPIPFATVYIDGTSNGTITDENGTFELSDVRPPAKLVVSHLSYRAVMVLVHDSTSNVNIEMQPKKLEISQVNIDASDNRARNLERFKRGFLGRDYWGENALLLNDSVLVFKREYQEKKRKVAGKDTVRLVESKFEVRPTSTVIIDMPKLGYTLYADLKYYRETPGHTSAYGYYYYKPYADGSRMKQKKIDKYRRKVYYNSTQHFCRALHSNTLLQEGYSINTKRFLSPGGTRVIARMARTAGLDSCLMPVNEYISSVKGLRDSAFMVEYYFNSRGLPMDLRENCNLEGKPVSKSVIYFTQDSCAFSKDGIIPGNGVSFRGAMANKRTGATLPRNYEVATK